MTKRARSGAGRSRPAPRTTNWTLIGGLIAVGLIVLAGLLFLATREPVVVSLEDYCAQNPTHCFARGPADAPVTLVEVSDYNCGACRAFHDQTADRLIQEYVETDQIRWLVLPFALWATTIPAAEAAFCAAEQDAFFAFHDNAFSLQNSSAGVSRAGFMQVAQQVGMDTEAYGRCLDSGRYSSAVQSNIRAAQAVGVKATPSFFVNGIKIEGAQPFATFQQRINSFLNF
jgi:protein-disulfide isomerase